MLNQNRSPNNRTCRQRLERFPRNTSAIQHLSATCHITCRACHDRQSQWHQGEKSAISSIMASETRLNQIVKGAPTANVKTPTTAPLQALGRSSQTEKYTPDPALSALPSSPPQIYLNLLILESSLRAQYLHLVSRRRLNTFFTLLLCLWNGFFFYALFLRPREDGTGLGGSVYWLVEMSEKLALMGGGITVLLVWGTGQWERGIRWPRKWLGTTNRGLRGFNLRVVVVRGKIWRELLGSLSFLLPLGMWREAGGSDWHLVEHEDGSIIEEDLAKGGDHVLLLLLPKAFSPEFRENWEEYRSEYWDKENERRAFLRRRLDIQRRAKAKDTGGWKWWTGSWRLFAHHPHRRHYDLEKHARSHHASRHGSVAEKDGASRPSSAVIKGRRNGLRSDSTHSRNSSRSTTPHLEMDGAGERPLSERVRRGSSVSSTASARRKTKDREKRDSLGAGLGLSPLTAASNVMSAEDEKEERRRRRKDREAAKEAREREKNAEREREKEERSGEDDSRPTTPKTEFVSIKSEPI